MASDLFSTENIDAEGKCLFQLLIEPISPAEIRQSFPMFYSQDKLLVFMLCVSLENYPLKSIPFKIPWKGRIRETVLRNELERQEKFYDSIGKPDHLLECDLMHLFVFIGDVLRYFGEIKLKSVNGMYDLLDLMNKEFRDINLPFTVWLHVNFKLSRCTVMVSYAFDNSWCLLRLFREFCDYQC